MLALGVSKLALIKTYYYVLGFVGGNHAPPGCITGVFVCPSSSKEKQQLHVSWGFCDMTLIRCPVCFFIGDHMQE